MAAIEFLIEASDVPFQVSNRTGGSQKDGAAESWEIDIINLNDRTVSNYTSGFLPTYDVVRQTYDIV